MRWSLELLSPALVVGDGSELLLGPDEAGRSARLKLSLADGRLVFDVEAQGLAESAPGLAHPEWYNRAHLALFLNPGHDHATRWLYGVDDTGAVTATADWAAPGEVPGEVRTARLAGPPAAEGSFEELGSGRFRIVLRVPADAVWPGGAAAAGLAVKVGFHEELIVRPLRWPAEIDWAGDTPLCFGDLYRSGPPLRVDRLELPEPAWAVPCPLSLRAVVGPGGPASGRVRIETILPGEGQQGQCELPWTADQEGNVALTAEVSFPHRGKWASDAREVARLAVAFSDDAGRPVWQAEYPFGFDCGIIVRERFGPIDGEQPPRPEPADPDFVEKFRRYVLARLPDYRLKTTRDGAPSDFYLADDAGRANLNLMAPDWPDAVAAMLAERFGQWDDALCAAAMWVYHPLITLHSSSWSGIAGRCTVQAVPRLGGCFCGDTGRLTAMLAERVGRCLDVPLRAWSLGLRGHIATLVDSPAGRVVLDGMIGLWFHTLDNTRLATLEEMRADRRIVQRMWYCPHAHGHEFFYGVDNQIIRDWNKAAVDFPV